MTTQLFAVDTSSDITLGTETKKLARTTRGTGLVSKITNTGASPPIQVTDGAGGAAITWYTGPWAAITISGTITFNWWALESATQANTGLRVRIERCSGNGAVISTIVNSARGIELGTSAAVQNWTATPTSTVLAVGDRLKITVSGDAVGTMGTGRTFTVGYGLGSSGANGDSFVTLTETLTASWAGSAALNATGALSAGSAQTAKGATALSATGSFLAGSGVTPFGQAVMNATAALTAGSAVGQTSTAALNTTAALTVGDSVTALGSAGLPATATFGAVGIVGLVDYRPSMLASFGYGAGRGAVAAFGYGGDILVTTREDVASFGYGGVVGGIASLGYGGVADANVRAGAALDASATLLAAATQTVTGSAGLNGSGTLVAVGAFSVSRALVSWVSFEVPEALPAASGALLNAIATLALGVRMPDDPTALGLTDELSAGILNAVGSFLAVGSATALDDPTALGLTEEGLAAAAALLNASGTLTVSGQVAGFRSAALNASGTLTARGLIVRLTAALLNASATLTAVGNQIAPGTGTLNANAALTAAGNQGVRGTVSLAGISSFSATGSAAGTGTPLLNATASLTATATLRFAGAATLNAAATLSANGQVTGFRAATLNATASLSAAGAVHFGVEPVGLLAQGRRIAITANGRILTLRAKERV